METLTPFILTLIFPMVIGSFVLYWVIKNAIDNSNIGKKLDRLNVELSELKQLMEKTDENKR